MFKRNLTFLSAINIYVKLTSLAIVPFMARRFSVEEFGLLTMAQSLLGYALDCFDGGVKKIGIRELSRAQDSSFHSLAEQIFSIRIWLLGAAFLFMNLMGVVVFDKAAYRIIIFIISLSILAQTMDITWIYDARQNMKLTAFSKFIERTIFLIVAVLGIVFVNIRLLAFSFPLSVLITGITVWFFMKDFKINFYPFINVNFIKEGLIIGFSSIAASLCLTIDQFMIEHYKGTYQLGLYSAATKLFFVVLTFLWIYAYALFPRLSKASADKKEIRQIMIKHTVYLGSLGTITVGVLSFFSDILIKVFFSEKFLPIVSVFKTLNIFLIIVFFNALFSDNLSAFDRQKTRLNIILQGLSLNVVGNLFLIPRYGLLGAVYSSIIAQLLILILSYYQLRKMYQLRIGWYITGFIIANLLLVKLSFL